MRIEDIKELMLRGSKVGLIERRQVQLSFSNLYAAANLEAPRVLFFESPNQLQCAIMRSLGRPIDPSMLNDQFKVLDDFLAETPFLSKLNQKIWKLVGNRIARPLYQFFGKEDLLETGFGDFSAAFQQVEAAVMQESLQLLNREGFGREKLAFHPNWTDYKWIKPFQAHLDAIPLAREISNIIDSGLMYAYCFDKLVLWCPKPTIIRSEDGVLHAENGPAISWPDGYSLFFWRGLRVPAKLISDPDSVKIEDLENFADPEVRASYQEILGAERFAKLFELEIVDADTDARGFQNYLYRSRMLDKKGKALIQFAKVVCPSTFREYFLVVPSDLRNVWEAVSWTIGKKAILRMG